MSNPTVTVVYPFYRLSDTKPVRWIPKEMEAEVLTIHIEKNRMRLRVMQWNEDKGKDVPTTMDTSAHLFFQKYSIEEK